MNVVVIFIPNNLNNRDNINTRIWITMQFDRAQRRRRLRASTVIAAPEARAGRRPDFVRKTMQPHRARGDVETQVARSAARGAEGINTRLNIAASKTRAAWSKATPTKPCLEEELPQSNRHTNTTQTVQPLSRFCNGCLVAVSFTRRFACIRHTPVCL